MTQQQIKGATGALGSGGSLDVYDVPGSVIITPYSVSATFDGSGASGAFLPCLTFKTQTGAIIARCPAPEVASGDTAEVSWFPHVAQAASASGSGIQYDIDNVGDWLWIKSTSATTALPDGSINDAGILLWSFPGGISQGGIGIADGDPDTPATETAGISIYEYGTAGGIRIHDFGTGGVNVEEDGDGGINLLDRGDGGIKLTSDGGDGIVLRDSGGAGISLLEPSGGTGGITLSDAGTGGIFLNGQSTGGIILRDDGAGGIFLIGLPSSNPGVAGQLWNNAGVVSIS